jgi:hypothetical protein
MRRMGLITGKRAALQAAVGLLLALAAFESSAEIYKYRDANGKVIFSDSAPQDVDQVEEVKPTINTGIPMPQRKGGNGSQTSTSGRDKNEVERERFRNESLRRAEERKKLHEELTQELQAARARLKQLQEERELNKAPRPEEWGHSAIRHNSWPKESYYKRITEMDKEIEEAKKEVTQAERNLRQMKRSPQKDEEK